MSGLIDDAECEKLTTLSRTTRWRREKEGTFPKRRKLGKARIAWVRSEVEEWIENLAK